MCNLYYVLLRLAPLILMHVCVCVCGGKIEWMKNNTKNTISSSSTAANTAAPIELLQYKLDNNKAINYMRARAITYVRVFIAAYKYTQVFIYAHQITILYFMYIYVGIYLCLELCIFYIENSDVFKNIGTRRALIRKASRE